MRQRCARAPPRFWPIRVGAGNLSLCRWRCVYGSFLICLRPMRHDSIELFAIRSLNAKNSGSVAQNVLNALDDIAANLNTWQIIDPANTNNIISEQHTAD